MGISWEVFKYEFLFHNALTTCVYTTSSWNVTFYMWCGHFRNVLRWKVDHKNGSIDILFFTLNWLVFWDIAWNLIFYTNYYQLISIFYANMF